MSGERESEEDVDIYGDIPNFLSLENTVKEVSFVEHLNLYVKVQNLNRSYSAVFFWN
jgi:hypothetical protein